MPYRYVPSSLLTPNTLISPSFLTQTLQHHSPHTATNVYVSEGRDRSIINQLQSIAHSTTTTSPSTSLVKLANVFIDELYHRSSFTLVSYSPTAMADRVAAITAAAIKMIDLEQHSAQHPRLGVVDHISCHPLLTDNKNNNNNMASTVTAAETIAKRLGGDSLHLPVYLYGHAHPQQRQLVDIRKSFGYFRPNTPTDITWKGAIQTPSPKYKVVQVPDYGPPPTSTSRSKTGIVCIGAIPWLINFNVLLNSSDAGVCKEIARAVSEKGGGLKAVQAMALKHDGGRYEVACNLLDESVSGVELVEKEIERLAGERGVGVVRCYRIGKKPEELLEILLGDGREC